MCSWDGTLIGSDNDGSYALRADLAARRVWRQPVRSALCCACGATRSTTAHAAFADSPPTTWRRPTAPAGGAMVDPDGLEPPTPAL